MDGERFDALARRLAEPASRRRMLGAMLGGLTSGFELACGSGSSRTRTRNVAATPLATPLATPPLDERTLTREECQARGGTFQRWGLVQQEFCQIPAADAGKRCTDGSMCSLGRCLTFTYTSPGACQEYRLVFGCQAAVSHGKVEPVICVD